MDPENNFVRATHRLTLDSDEDQRIQQQQQKLREEKRLKKQEKRKRRQQAQIAAEKQAAQQMLEDLQIEQQPKLYDQDSNSKAQFANVIKKIRKAYPSFRSPEELKQKKKKKYISQSQSDGLQSDQQSEKPKKKQKTRKIQKKKVNDQPRRQTVKIQGDSKKDNFVQQIAIRWWYALPQWPPQNYDFNVQLNKIGYRCVDPNFFKHEQQVVDGLVKVMPVPGFNGVYKSKYKLIDVRMKQNAPTLQYFNSLSIDELSKLLKIALTEQIRQLKNVEYQQCGEKQLLNQLQKMLLKVT